MSVKVKADSAELWDLYTEIGEVKSMADNECNELRRMLSKLDEWLQSVKQKTEREIENLEQQVAQLKRKALEDENSGTEGMAEAIQQRIRQLEMYVQEVKQYISRIPSYERQIEKGKKAYTSSIRAGQRKVNRYIKFLEELTLDEDFANYQASKQSAASGNGSGNSGGFHTMTFRGMVFYCNDSQIDISRSDGKRTNLQRMEQGLAPLGSDGLSMNLHHMQQSQQTGGIMELSETVHKDNHGTLHINTNDIPSGINRSTFNQLKKSYWKRRAAFIKKEQGL